MTNTAEQKRLDEHYVQQKNWLHWGPYLSERQWGTVREDYSPGGTAWDFFPHDHARSRVYRWGEDGIAGISDEWQRLCFSVCLWNGKDPILKERLFGLTGNEGNHGEDVKELYYYLDSTPTHSWMRHLYKYPRAEFPYARLLEENRRRSRQEPEFELLDTGIFDDNRYWDVFTEYAKAGPDDLLIKITAHNRGADAADLWLLPTLWFRNLWSFGLMNEKPRISVSGDQEVRLWHEKMGDYHFYFQTPGRLLFTENENNHERLWGQPNETPFVKDAFHTAVINQDFSWLETKTEGTKFAPLYHFTVEGGQSVELRLRLSKTALTTPLGKDFDKVFKQRQKEADEFYAGLAAGITDPERQNIQRQALAGMLWTKQYFNIDMPRWLDGDPGQLAPPESRKTGRNSHWRSLNNEDIISMPDKWEYPWYAAWDLAFHCVPLAMVDPQFAKNQLILFLREWYMHPNGQLPAYEWAFGDVNPPVHAWSCLQVYKMEKDKTGAGDVDFLKRVFQKLLINFTWWVNRKDHKGNNVFEGGFLGLDNIGVFDRSNQIPGGGYLEQADGTAWMAMYCLNMLEMALEIAQHDPSFEDVATKFFEHFVYIAESLNRIGHDWMGAWDEQEGFFYDILALADGRYIPLKVRSLVGLSTLFAVYRLPKAYLENLPDFTTRLRWFQRYRTDNGQYLVLEEDPVGGDLLLSLIPRERLSRLLQAMLDEREFLSPGGIRSISKIHEAGYSVDIDGQAFGLKYEPGESGSGLFGGNSNWRGPVWMPMNYLLIKALREYSAFYGTGYQAEFPTGSGRWICLDEAADALSERLISVFEPGPDGRRPANGQEDIYARDPHFRNLVLFYEYFHGDTARGVGASHQTGWTGVVAKLIGEVR
ncbi:MAG: glucosidase [Thermoanaerobaculia bacterium]|nr:glucosidase [Thermoanaerobaculia bacterium]